jgi:hypothetical protein
MEDMTFSSQLWPSQSTCDFATPFEDLARGTPGQFRWDTIEVLSSERGTSAEPSIEPSNSTILNKRDFDNENLDNSSARPNKKLKKSSLAVQSIFFNG